MLFISSINNFLKHFYTIARLPEESETRLREEYLDDYMGYETNIDNQWTVSIVMGKKADNIYHTNEQFKITAKRMKALHNNIHEIHRLYGFPGAGDIIFDGFYSLTVHQRCFTFIDNKKRVTLLLR